MEEIIKIIGNYGVMVLIVVLYVWGNIKQTKYIETTLTEIKSYWDAVKPVIEILRDETMNRSAVLNAMQSSIDTVNATVQRTDKITEYMQSDIREIRAILNKSPLLTDKGDDFRA